MANAGVGIDMDFNSLADDHPQTRVMSESIAGDVPSFSGSRVSGVRASAAAGPSPFARSSMADQQLNNMRNVAFADDQDQPPLPPTAAPREGNGKKGLFQTRNLLIVTLILLAGAIGLAAYFGVSSQSNNENRSTGGADSDPVIPLSPDSNSSTSTDDQTSPCCSLDNVTCFYDCDQYECGKPYSSKCSAGTLINNSVGSVGGLNGTNLDGILVDIFSSLFPTDPTTGSGIVSDIDFLRWLNQSSLTNDYFGNSRTKFGLVNLYYSTNGREWTANNNWLSPSSFCIWYGVTCDSSGTLVTHLDLPNNNLVGTIARDFLLLLGEQGLISLDLGLNKLYGSIPPEGLRTLTRLQSLSLYNNSLTGGIPSEIESLVGLQLLFMGNNDLKGTIPITIGKLGSLQKLDLHNNQMTGSLPLSVGLLQSLTQLYLSSNSFNSFLPTEIGALKSLQELYLDGNGFSGPIPPSLGNINTLMDCRLYSNKFQGNIPTTLGNLVNLNILYLDDNSFWGTIPTELQGLQNLRELSLFENQLTGTVPTELGVLFKLEVLALNANNIGGTIPNSLAQLPNLSYLDLGSTKLTGTIPYDLCTMQPNPLSALTVPCNVLGCYTQCN